MTAQTTKPKPKPTRKIDRTKVTDLVINKGLTQQQAAKLSNCAQSRVSQIISEATENKDRILFSEHKDKVFEDLQLKLCNLADNDTLKKMLERRGMTDVAILEDKIRTIRGQATEISDVQLRGLILHFKGKSVDNPVDI